MERTQIIDDYEYALDFLHASQLHVTYESSQGISYLMTTDYEYVYYYTSPQQLVSGCSCCWQLSPYHHMSPVSGPGCLWKEARINAAPVCMDLRVCRTTGIRAPASVRPHLYQSECVYGHSLQTHHPHIKTSVYVYVYVYAYVQYVCVSVSCLLERMDVHA